jgi:hypothetical protein
METGSDWSAAETAVENEAGSAGTVSTEFGRTSLVKHVEEEDEEEAGEKQ